MSRKRIEGAVAAGGTWLAFLIVLICQVEAAMRKDNPALRPTLQRTAASTGKMQVPDRSQHPCGFTLTVRGGKFVPDFCQFEIISGGQICPNPSKCKRNYAINLRSERPAPDEVQSIVLFNLRKFETGTYTFDPVAGLEDFKGQLIDRGAIARHLLRGSITLNVQRDDEVEIALDVHFANGIVAQGSGVIDVKRVNAP